MQNLTTKECLAYKIPFPSELLGKEWGGIVYALTTVYLEEDDHHKLVESKISELISEFDAKSHWSVSLRQVKKMLAVSYPEQLSFCTLVQFRVRDSY